VVRCTVEIYIFTAGLCNLLRAGRREVWCAGLTILSRTSFAMADVTGGSENFSSVCDVLVSERSLGRAVGNPVSQRRRRGSRDLHIWSAAIAQREKG